MAVELRMAGGDPPRLVGYAAVFNAPSEDLGGFVEYVRPGAFTRSLSSGPDVVALVHHRPELVLGRSSAGTLRLHEDAHGLRFEVDLPDTQAGRDVGVSVQRGDIRGASFAFSVPDGGDRWQMQGDLMTRDLLDVNIRDVTVTATPAYPDTTVAKRAMGALMERAYEPRLALAMRFLETV
ncbi:MAG: HK97 family phage prohead protease [Leptospirillia bacterium]